MTAHLPRARGRRDRLVFKADRRFCIMKFKAITRLERTDCEQVSGRLGGATALVSSMASNVKGGAAQVFFFVTLQPRVECYTGLLALNTSPPRNRFIFLCSSGSPVEDCTDRCRRWRAALRAAPPRCQHVERETPRFIIFRPSGISIFVFA